MHGKYLLFLTWKLCFRMMLHTLGVTTDTFNQIYRQIHQAKNRPGKRNTKFIIPALISHMYHQKLDESPLSTMLQPFAKRVGKQDNGKRESAADSLEHRTIVGNPKRDEHVRNVPKTKCPQVKIKELPVQLEVQSLEKEDKRSDNHQHSGGNVIEVNKHFSPLSKNWYPGPPSMLWPPYPNSYGMPLGQYPNPRLPRPLYPGSSEFQQEGFIQHIMGPTRNKFLINTNLKDDGLNKNVVAQGRKFMVTNITKYVLDFYCPHCGGEISVSKNRNRGGIFGTDQGAISVNKGERDPNESKPKSTTPPYSKHTKTQQLN